MKILGQPLRNGLNGQCDLVRKGCENYTQHKIAHASNFQRHTSDSCRLEAVSNLEVPTLSFLRLSFQLFGEFLVGFLNFALKSFELREGLAHLLFKASNPVLQRAARADSYAAHPK